MTFKAPLDCGLIQWSLCVLLVLTWCNLDCCWRCRICSVNRHTKWKEARYSVVSQFPFLPNTEGARQGGRPMLQALAAVLMPDGRQCCLVCRTAVRVTPLPIRHRLREGAQTRPVLNRGVGLSAGPPNPFPHPNMRTHTHTRYAPTPSPLHTHAHAPHELC